MKHYETINPSTDDVRGMQLDPALYIAEVKLLDDTGAPLRSTAITGYEAFERALDFVNFPFRAVMGQEEVFDVPFKVLRDLQTVVKGYLKDTAYLPSSTVGGVSENLDDYVHINITETLNVQWLFSQLQLDDVLPVGTQVQVTLYTDDNQADAVKYPKRVKLIEHSIGEQYEVDTINRPFDFLYIAAPSNSDEISTTYLKDDGSVDRKEKLLVRVLFGALNQRINERSSVYPLRLDFNKIKKIEPSNLDRPSAPGTGSLNLIEITM